MKTKSHIRLVTDILGTRVNSRQGENIGVVQNLMVNSQTDAISYVVLCFGNFIGKTHRYFAIPSYLLKWGSERKEALIMDVSPDELLQATHLPPDSWSSPMEKDDPRAYELYRVEAGEPQDDINVVNHP